MKIIHASGEAYELKPDTHLELTRTNPFFHQIGEQSLPISLPGSAHNFTLLQQPQRTDNRKKLSSRIDTQVQSGIFVVNARQAILSAKEGEDIETSFYLREGAFYEKIKDISLVEIFAEKKIEFANVDAAIEFVRSLITITDHRFACFQVITEKYMINQFAATRADGFASLFKEAPTTETIDDKQITVPKGFYISPFVKVKHVLQEVLAWLGYTLAPSFLDNPPFSDMVFLNDNLDTIVNGRINYVDIVPNIMVSTLLEILRKFNLEIIPDEQTKTIHLKLFKDIMAAPAAADLSYAVRDKGKINYHHNYRQIKLSSEKQTLPSETYAFYYNNPLYKYSLEYMNSDFQNIFSILAQYPGAYLRKQDGAILADGFRGALPYQKWLASLSIGYFAGGTLQAEEKNFPDVIPEVVTTVRSYVSGYTEVLSYPFAGNGRFLQSAIQLSDSSITDQSSSKELKPMLCFVYRSTSYDIGTLSNYDKTGVRLWDYSLHYNGADGIYERFWRGYDNLLRNAMLEVEFNLLLSEKDKFQISSHEKINIFSQEFLLSEMKYVPEMQTVESCTFLSLKQQDPLSTAKSESEYFIPAPYKWVIKSSKNFTVSPPQAAREAINYESEPTAFFPPPPTQAQYTAGGRYFEVQYQVEYGYIDTRNGVFTKLGDGIVTVWLEAALNA